MSDVQKAISGLSKTQKAIMEADDFETHANAAGRQTQDSLMRKGLVELKESDKGGYHVVELTDLGTDVRNALLGGKPANVCTPDEAREAFLDLITGDAEAAVPVLMATGLTEDDIVDHDLLIEAFVGEHFESGVPELKPTFSEALVLRASLAAAFSTLAIVLHDESDGIPYLDAFNGDNVTKLFAAQYKSVGIFKTETLFRMVVPNAGDHWADCPQWLKLWLDVFASTVMGLKPHVIAARDALEACVREAVDMKRNRRNKAKSDEKRAAKLKKKKDRLRKMKARREAAEKANATA